MIAKVFFLTKENHLISAKILRDQRVCRSALPASDVAFDDSIIKQIVENDELTMSRTNARLVG
jgi:hypothetical protein